MPGRTEFYGPSVKCEKHHKDTFLMRSLLLVKQSMSEFVSPWPKPAPTAAAPNGRGSGAP